MSPRSLLALLLAGSAAFLASAVHAGAATGDSPEAGGRPYGANYKDMVLSICISRAYESEKGASEDAASSASALIDWTYYDLEHSPDEIESLVKKYLSRDYHNPLVEPAHKDIEFNLLKCLDLYHSKELAAQVKKFVAKPNRTYRQDHPK